MLEIDDPRVTLRKILSILKEENSYATIVL
jgi:hypothetical protein